MPWFLARRAGGRAESQRTVRSGSAASPDLQEQARRAGGHADDRQEQQQEGQQARGLRGAITGRAAVLAALLLRPMRCVPVAARPASRERRRRGPRGRRSDTTTGWRGRCGGRAPSDAPRRARAPRRALVTTLPVTLDATRPPFADDAGDRLAAGVRGTARMATRPSASRCMLTRNSPRAAPSASRKSPNVARFKASSSPPTEMRCHSQLRPPGWRGASALRMTRLTSASAAARSARSSLTLCSAPLDGRNSNRFSSTRPVTSTVWPAHRATSLRQRRRIDGVDQRRLGLRIEPRIGGQRGRPAGLQRQRADARAAERPLELGDRLVEQRALAQIATSRLGRTAANSASGRHRSGAPADSCRRRRRRRGSTPGGRSFRQRAVAEQRLLAEIDAELGARRRLGQQRRHDALQFLGRAGSEHVAVAVDELPVPLGRRVGGEHGALRRAGKRSGRPRRAPARRRRSLPAPTSRLGPRRAQACQPVCLRHRRGRRQQQRRAGAAQQRMTDRPGKCIACFPLPPTSTTRCLDRIQPERL